MPYLTLFLIASAPLVIEWLASNTVPTLWHRPRWCVLPAVGGALGGFVPMQVIGELPWFEHGLSAFLGLVFGLLVALFGHFRATFWSGPSESDLARTGRRSYFATRQTKGERPRL